MLKVLNITMHKKRLKKKKPKKTIKLNPRTKLKYMVFQITCLHKKAYQEHTTGEHHILMQKDLPKKDLLFQ